TARPTPLVLRTVGPPRRRLGHRAFATRLRLFAQSLDLRHRRRAVAVLLPTGRQPGDRPSLAAPGRPGLAPPSTGPASPGSVPDKQSAGVAAAAEELAGRRGGRLRG